MDNNTKAMLHNASDLEAFLAYDIQCGTMVKCHRRLEIEHEDDSLVPWDVCEFTPESLDYDIEDDGLAVDNYRVGTSLMPEDASMASILAASSFLISDEGEIEAEEALTRYRPLYVQRRDSDEVFPYECYVEDLEL